MRQIRTSGSMSGRWKRSASRHRATSRLHLVAAVAVLWGTQTFACGDDAPAKTYVIKLARPSHVGEKYEITAAGSERTRYEIRVPGKDATYADKTTAVQLEGVVEVLAVDAKGSATKLSCTVKKLVRTDAKDPVEVLPACTVVTAESARKAGNAEAYETRFTLKEGELTQEQKTALGLVIDASSPGAATDDEIFGNDKPQKIGATWPINSAKAAEDFKNSGVVIDPNDLTGDSTLAGTVEVSGHKYLQVKATLSAKNLKSSAEGVKVEKSTIDGKFSGLVSDDAQSIRSAQVQDFQMMMTSKVNAPDGSLANVISLTTIHKEVESRPMR